MDDPDTAYPDGDAAWKRFSSLFASIEGILFYTPVLFDFTYEVLREFYEDNVQYVEMRGTMPPVQTKYSFVQVGLWYSHM